MDHFELLEPLSPEEREALKCYKDFSDDLSAALRGGQLTTELTRRRDALDSALLKGISTQALTLYRATCATYFPAAVGAEFNDPAFASTSLSPEGLVAFYCAEAPAKLEIHYLANRQLACFEFDAGGGQENECLLPRGTRFRVLASTQVEDRAAILREQRTAFDRGEFYLKRGAKLLLLQLGLVS